MKIKDFKTKIVVTLIIFLYTLVIYVSPISCVFLWLTGFKCPGCGMTRALVAAIKTDFVLAYSYHKMFWSLPFLYIAFLKDGKIFKNKIMNILFYSIVGIGFLINWLY